MYLELVQAIQQIRSPFIDFFFILLNFFDTSAFFFLLIPAVWFGKSWKAGIRLFAIILLCTFTISSLKNLFCLPRPFHLLPSLAVIQVSGYGFPSGAAAGSLLLSGLLVTYSKMKAKWILAFSFVFFVSLSRLYLGVHFFEDLLGGWFVGLTLWAFFVFGFPHIERWLSKRSTLFLMLFSAIVPLLLCMINLEILVPCAIAMGICLSIFVVKHLRWTPPLPKKVKESFVKGLLGAALSFILFLGVKKIFTTPEIWLHFLTAYLLGFAIGVIGSYLCKNIPYSREKT